MVRAQIGQKEKDRRILQLTIGEISELPRDEDVQLYKGVGKMYAFGVTRLHCDSLLVYDAV